MKKKLIMLTLLIVIFCVVPIYAEEDVEVVIPNFPVVLNDTDYDSSDAMYPLINYNGITYFPMTWNLGQTLGLSTNYSTSNGLEIKLGKPTGELTYNKGEENDLTTSYKASLPSYNITVNGNVIDNNTEDYPILSFREITYFPLTWKYAVEEFQWDYSFTNENGLGIIAEVESEPLVQMAEIEGVEASKPSDIIEITNSFRTANQWKVEDDYFHLSLTGDSRSLDFSLKSEDLSFLDSDIKYDIFAYIVELYSGKEMTYKATLYRNYDTDRKFQIGMGSPFVIHSEDLEDVEKVVYRIQFMESSKCEAFFDGKLIETVDLSKLNNFTSYIESRDEIYTEYDIVDEEIVDEREAVRIINVLPESVKEEFNIVHNYGSGFRSQNSIDEVIGTLSEQFSLAMISTVERESGTMNLIESRKYHVDKLPVTEEYDYMRRFEYQKRNNGGVSLYFLLDNDYDIIGYIDYY